MRILVLFLLNESFDFVGHLFELLLNLWDHCCTLDDEDEPYDSRHRHFLSDVGSGRQSWQCECQEAIRRLRLKRSRRREKLTHLSLACDNFGTAVVKTPLLLVRKWPVGEHLFVKFANECFYGQIYCEQNRNKSQNGGIRGENDCIDGGV